MVMTFDDDVSAACKRALYRIGSGTTGSRVLNVTYRGHKECEEALKEFYAMDHAMVFSTGYQANLGIISTIAGKGDYVILDIDSHASIYDGRSEEHTSELQSLMRISYAVFCLKKKKIELHKPTMQD